MFKKEMKLSPLEYLNKLRMKNAEKLLISMRSNEYTMAEIAQMCGFEDPLYFSRVFKKYCGCAPSVFAKERMCHTVGEQDRTEIEMDGDSA
jgi:AraC-like DNA-binding protein